MYKQVFNAEHYELRFNLQMLTNLMRFVQWFVIFGNLFCIKEEREKHMAEDRENYELFFNVIVWVEHSREEIVVTS